MRKFITQVFIPIMVAVISHLFEKLFDVWLAKHHYHKYKYKHRRH